jgi:hypothetical protein
MEEKYSEDVVRLLASWVDCTAGLDNAFNGEDPNEEARPLAAKQLRYYYANLAIANLLRANGHQDLAHPFIELAEVFYDTAHGIGHPLFTIEQRRKRGGQPDTSAVWRLRARICVAMKYLMAGGMTEDDAIQAASKYRTEFGRLLRPDSSGLPGSLSAWLKEFASDKAQQVALAIYKDGVDDIPKYQLGHTGVEAQREGTKRLKDAARLAADLPSKPKSKPNRHSDS